MKNPKFQIFAGGGGQIYFRLRAKNGQIILRSDGYVTKSACRKGIRSVQKNAPNDVRYLRKESPNGMLYFVLVAANRRVIGISEMYTTRRWRDAGIEVVKRTAPGAPVEDATKAIW